MILQSVELQTTEETVLYYSLAWTWPWYVLGALYFVAPAVAWLLFGLWLWRKISAEEVLPNRPVTPLVVVWWLGMLVMLVALVIGHLNWDLGLPQLLKSSIGWMKGWALFAIFAMIGACLHVRPEVIYRAATMVVMHTAVLLPLLIVAPFIGIPGQLYTSPLIVLGGPGLEYFQVQLFSAGFDGGLRWRFFAPWAPAAAVAFGVLAPLALRERSLAMQTIGVFVIIAVIMMSKSRLGLISIPVALMATAALSRLTNVRLLLSTAGILLVLGILGEVVVDTILEQKERMNQMRPDSNYVRDGLARLALHRWQTEAPIWGHGIVEQGPSFVEEMPIGSHHSWYGLLFVKGAVGFAALLIPLLFTWGEMIAKAQKERTARTALTFALLFTFFTFTENVEMLAYLIWPAFVVIGIASRKRMVSAFRSPLGAPRAMNTASLVAAPA